MLIACLNPPDGYDQTGVSLGNTRFFMHSLSNKIRLLTISCNRQLLCAVSLVVFLPLSAFSVCANELEEVHALAQGGAASLAIRLIDNYQPSVTSDQQAWILWERERFSVYQMSTNWKALVNRLEQLPPGLPDEFALWAMSQHAAAFLELGRGKAARDILQALIWATSDEGLGQWLMSWRRMVIRSYMVDGQANDAHMSILRFHQDYGEQDFEDRLLRARILLMSGRPAEATEILEKHSTRPQASMLYLLGQLRSHALSPRKVVQAGLRQLEGEWVNAELEAHLWAIVAESSQHSGDRALNANALEHVLANQSYSSPHVGLFNFNADSLWNSYLDYATYLGNEAQFLIGDDGMWFTAAAEAEKKTPVKARSFYAMLIHEAQNEANRFRAASLFVNSMQGRKQGKVLLYKIFMESKYFTAVSTIPIPVRHLLVDLALAASDISQASRLMATIQEPPEGKDNYMWYLRRARILILGGSIIEGTKTLEKVLQAHEDMAEEQLSRLLQVIFDLQTVGEHNAAYKLFELSLRKIADIQLQREIMYWMADSRMAQKRYDEAARLYLKSAMSSAPDAMDPWAQTARYQAARSLAKAGLKNDARSLYRQLLDVTEEHDRRKVLQYELQRLWIAE